MRENGRLDIMPQNIYVYCSIKMFGYYTIGNVTQGYKCVTINAIGCEFPFEVFSFLRSGIEAKRGIEFRHSTRNASRIRRKRGVS